MSLSTFSFNGLTVEDLINEITNLYFLNRVQLRRYLSILILLIDREDPLTNKCPYTPDEFLKIYIMQMFFHIYCSYHIPDYFYIDRYGSGMHDDIDYFKSFTNQLAQWICGYYTNDPFNGLRYGNILFREVRSLNFVFFFARYYSYYVHGESNERIYKITSSNSNSVLRTMVPELDALNLHLELPINVAYDPFTFRETLGGMFTVQQDFSVPSDYDNSSYNFFPLGCVQCN